MSIPIKQSTIEVFRRQLWRWLIQTRKRICFLCTCQSFVASTFGFKFSLSDFSATRQLSMKLTWLGTFSTASMAVVKCCTALSCWPFAHACMWEKEEQKWAGQWVSAGNKVQKGCQRMLEGLALELLSEASKWQQSWIKGLSHREGIRDEEEERKQAQAQKYVPHEIKAGHGCIYIYISFVRFSDSAKAKSFFAERPASTAVHMHIFSFTHTSFNWQTRAHTHTPSHMPRSHSHSHTIQCYRCVYTTCTILWSCKIPRGGTNVIRRIWGRKKGKTHNRFPMRHAHRQRRRSAALPGSVACNYTHTKIQQKMTEGTREKTKGTQAHRRVKREREWRRRKAEEWGWG